jgi:peroxiredoxin
MDAYRDQYAKLFNNGKDVVLLAISVDAPAAQQSWASDRGYAWRFLSDSGGAVGKLYHSTAGRQDNRSLFVIDKHGRVTHVMQPFREVDATAYTELGEAIAAARKVR